MRSRAFRLVVLFSLLVLAVVLPSVLSGGGEKNRAAANPAVPYAPGPEEVESLNSLEGYMAHRMTYPTGHFDQRWLLKAAKQAKLIRSGIPAGARPAYKPGTDKAGAINALDPDAFTSLGPQPQVSTGCQAPCFTFGPVSGRVNAITIREQGYTPGAGIAYIGVDGGGIWRSTDCCTPSTTWTVTTDGPLVSTTSISDIAIDPNNPNVVYGATGDLSFGSFSFGSSGVLKSTSAGAPDTWQVLAADVFTPRFPQIAGPYPQYQAVSKIRIDPNSDPSPSPSDHSQRLIAGTKTGVFFSYDAGANWTGPCLTSSFTSQRQDISDLIVVDAGATTDLYAAVGARGFATHVQFNLGLNGANGIYKTTVPASGCPASWTLITTGINGWPAGTGAGTPCDPPIGDNTELCGAAENKLGRIEMAVAPSTTNDADPSVVTIYAEVQAIDPHARCGALQVLGEGTARGCFLGLWRTTNSGTTWTQQSDHTKMDPLTSPAAGPCGEDTPQMWYDMGVAVDPTNPNVLFMDAIDIWKSNDGGVTLTDISCGYHAGLNPVGAPVHVDNHALAYAPPVGGVAATLLAGNDGGVYVSQNANVPPPPAPPVPGVGNTFVQLNSTLSTIEFYSGDISANFATDTDPFIVGGAQDNGSSYFQFTSGPGCPPAGCQWSQRIGGDGMFARIEPKQGQRVFMESQVGNLQRSTTGPAGPYTGVAQPWAGDAPRVSFIFPYEIDKFACPLATCDHMIGGSYRVWESIDGGTTWTPNSPDLTKNTLGDRSFINQLSYAYLTNGRAIVGTNDGNVQYGFGLGTGVANDADWVNVTGGNAVLPNRPIQDVVMSPSNNLVGYAAVGGFDENTPATPGHVFQVTCSNSVCASFSWANKTGNLPNIPVNSIVANPNVPKQVFAGTDWGLYYTDDISVASPIWLHFQEGLPNTMIWDMAIDRGATTLAVFTRARGAFAWPLPTVSPNLVTLFFDDFEPPAPIHVWSVIADGTCTWKDTTDAHSPTHAWTTEPYTDNCDTHLTSPPIVIPGTASNVKLKFWEHHDTEYDIPCGGPGLQCDYGFVTISKNGGTFEPIGPFFQGGTPVDPYAQVTIPLPNDVAGKTIQVRFTFHADATVSDPLHRGWFVDDVEISGEVGPTAVTIRSFAAKPTRRGVALTWRTAAEANVLGFNVWRTAKGKSVKVNRTLVAAKGRAGGARYSLVDRGARPGVAYRYRLQLVGKDGRRTWAARAAVRLKR